MRTIIAGSRNLPYVETIAAIKMCAWHNEITAVVSGGCRGPDKHGEAFARAYGLPITVVRADWKTFGKAAGPRRNKEMAQKADALIAVWDGASRGTRNMIEEAKLHGLKVYIAIVTI